ncbi:MAG: hypothetical protein K2J99_09380 [Lachnospiraceae bacterium]|nr:hypothetical protein [Lachnospiraceae bacterium]
MQKGKIILIVLAITSGIVGCGSEKTPDVKSISIGKDGMIAHQIVGGFEENYDMDEIEKLASDRVAEYCADNGADSVMLESVDQTDGKVLIKLNYATAQDYNDFNHREMFVGTVAEADQQGYQLENIAFISADGKPMEIGYIEDHDKTQIAIIGTKPTEEMVVNIYGKILYINQSATSDLDVSFSGKKGVHITHPQIEDGTGESVLSYIIFE